MIPSTVRTGIYQHYKGGLYQLIGIGEHTETYQLLVAIVPLDVREGYRLRFRPAEQFFDFHYEDNSGKIVESPTPFQVRHNIVHTVERFRYVGTHLTPQQVEQHKTGERIGSY